MRLFVALNFPKKERDRIHRATRPLRESDMPVRWVPADQFHVTLKFLGEVRRERVEELGKAISRVTSTTKAFATKFGGCGAFPSVRQPQVIWLGLGANPELRCLKQDLEYSFGDVGFEAGTRAFHPHITLGRADDRDGAGAFRGLDDALAALECAGEVKVQSVDLMMSQTSAQGSKYTVLSSARLVP
jgi:2'-5' RNA ligase